MIIFEHEKNRPDFLKYVKKENGLYLSIRFYKNEIVLSEDYNDLKSSCLLKDWLKFYDHGPIIFNIKENGLEDILLKKYSDINFLLTGLDTNSMLELGRKGEKRFMIPVSDLEEGVLLKRMKKIGSSLLLKFYASFIDLDTIEEIRKVNLPIYFVSPEVNGSWEISAKANNLNFFLENNIELSGIITKTPLLWR